MSLYLKKYLGNDKRTSKARKNIIASIGIKCIDVIVSLLLVPITLGYLNPYEYGIWLTMNSVLMWINSFDIGLGNGLRNKLAEAIAKGDKKLAKKYVSTTFIMLSIIVIAFLSIYFSFFKWIDWYSILNTSRSQISSLNNIVAITLTIIGLSFVLKVIGSIFLALQLPAINNGMIAIGHLLSLILIFIATKVFPGSLMIVAIIFTASPLIVYIIAYPITFNHLYRYMSPSLGCFHVKYLKELFGISIQFFVMQLAGILLFSMTNLIISHLLGPEKVTPYNIAYRYFSIVPMIIGFVITPMWSATTDAYAQGDIDWIKKTILNIRKYLWAAVAFIIIMLLLSNIVYSIWIGNEVSIPFVISALMAIYIGIFVISLTYSNFLNGLGKLKIQTINTILVALLFCPICFILGRNLGIVGIITTMCLLNIPGLILNIIQFNKIINGKAKGIWNR